VKRQGGLPLLTAYPLVDASTAAASFGQWLGWWAIVTGVGLWRADSSGPLKF
jgi:hypothetical protein